MHRRTCRLYNRPEPAPHRSDQGRDTWTDIGLQPEDPTIAELLKPHDYATGQFGKNHFGDKDEFMPSNHGFDKFFGNLYHLNAEEEPEDPDYPKDPEFKKRFGPRGVIYSFADGRIEDTGPLTKKRLETIDDDRGVAIFAIDFSVRPARKISQNTRPLMPSAALLRPFRPNNGSKHRYAMT